MVAERHEVIKDIFEPGAVQTLPINDGFVRVAFATASFRIAAAEALLPSIRSSDCLLRAAAGRNRLRLQMTLPALQSLMIDRSWNEMTVVAAATSTLTNVPSDCCPWCRRTRRRPRIAAVRAGDDCAHLALVRGILGGFPDQRERARLEVMIQRARASP